MTLPRQSSKPVLFLDLHHTGPLETCLPPLGAEHVVLTSGGVWKGRAGWADGSKDRDECCTPYSLDLVRGSLDRGSPDPWQGSPPGEVRPVLLPSVSPPTPSRARGSSATVCCLALRSATPCSPAVSRYVPEVWPTSLRWPIRSQWTESGGGGDCWGRGGRVSLPLPAPVLFLLGFHWLPDASD